MDRCIVYTRIRLLLPIRRFIVAPLWKNGGNTGFALSCHHFVILVTFQIKVFCHTFLNTVRPRRLKVGTHLYSGQMYCVYRNQAAAAYSSLYFFIFLSLQFSNIKIFRHTFSGTMRPRRLKLGTHMDSRQLYRVYQNQVAAAYSSLYFFIFLSLQFSNIKIFRHTFPRNCEV